MAKSTEKMERKPITIAFPLKSLGIPFVLAVAWATGELYSSGPDVSLGGGFFLSILKWFAAFAVLFVGARMLFARKSMRGDSADASRQVRPVKRWLIMSALIFLLWLPYLFALYPGSLSNDTFGQLGWFYSNIVQGSGEPLSDHHPVMDTLFMGAVVRLGQLLFGTMKSGIFLYMVLQYVFTSMSMALVVMYCERRLRLKVAWCGGVFVAIAVFPLFPLLTANMSKDALFSWVFVLYAIFFMEICRSEGSALDSRRFLAVFVVLCIAMGLTRKLGMYVVLISLLIVLIVGRRQMLKVIIPAASVCLVMIVAMPLAFSLFGVTPGGKQEMISVPLNQSGLYAVRHPEDRTEEEAETIERIFGMSDIAPCYTPQIADGVKSHVQAGGKLNDYFAYVKMWIAQGVRHPGTYADAFFALESGWISSRSIAVLFDSSWHSQYRADVMPEAIYDHGPFNDGAAQFLADVYAVWGQMPLLNLLVASGTYMTLIPCLALSLLLYKRRTLGIVAISPVLVSAALAFLSPVSIGGEAMRYVLPFVFQAPLLVSWCAYNYANCDGRRASVAQASG